MWALLHAVYGVPLMPLVPMMAVAAVTAPSTDSMTFSLRVVMLAVSLVAWLVSTTWIRRLRAAREPDVWIRAGREGVSVRVPGDVTLSSLGLGYSWIAFDLRWKDVRTWYPFLRTVNLIPVERSLRFETVDGRLLTVPVVSFAESQDELVGKIQKATGNGGRE